MRMLCNLIGTKELNILFRVRSLFSLFIIDLQKCLVLFLIDW